MKHFYKLILTVTLISYCIYSGAQWQGMDSPRGTKVNSVANFNSDNLVSTNKGLYFFDKTSKALTTYSVDNPEFTNANCFYQVDENLLFIGTVTKGILRSLDGGTTWYVTNNNMTGNTVYSFCTTEQNIYICTDDGVFVSANQGTNWSKVNLPTNKSYYSIKEIDTVFFLASSNGLFKSYDTLKTIVTANVSGKILSLEENNGRLAVLSHTTGINYSNDTSKTWVPRNGDLPVAELTSLAFEGALLCASSGDTIYRSDNTGVSWEAVFGAKDQVIDRLFISGSDVFAGSIDYLLHSADQGENWNAINDIFPEKEITNYLVIGDSIFIKTKDYNIYLSDSKADWQIYCLASDNNFRINRFYHRDSLVIGVGDKTYISNDTLKSWKLSYNDDLNSFLFIGDTIIAFSWSEGVIRSTDNGETWLQSNIGITNATDRVLKYLFEYNGDIYCYHTGDNVYYKSDNLGDTWQDAGNNFQGLDHIIDIISNNGIAIAPTYNYDTYVLNSDDTWSKISNNPISNIIIGENSNEIFSISTAGALRYVSDSTWSLISRGLHPDTVISQVNDNEFNLIEYNFSELSLHDGELFGLSNAKLYSRPVSDCYNVINTPVFYNCYTDLSGEVVSVRFNLQWHRSTTEGVTHYDLYDSEILGHTVASSETSFSYNDYNEPQNTRTIWIYASVDGDRSLPDIIHIKSQAGESAATTSISDIDQEYSDVLIYPNPVSDVINISDEMDFPLNKITITDIYGKLVYQSEPKAILKRIDVSTLKQGMYIIQIDAENKIMNQMFFKQ